MFHCCSQAIPFVTCVTPTEVVSNHYRYRDMIDNHNGMHMHPIALEETWLTSHWPNRVFSFLLAVTVVNVQNAATYFFNKEKINALTAKHLIARDLIFNKHMKTVEEPTFSKQRCRGPIDHFLITLPKKIQKRTTGGLQRPISEADMWCLPH